MARNERLVVILIEPFDFAQGKPAEEFEIWPLHITIVPWFHSDDDEKLDAVLQKVASRHQSFTVTAGKVEQWGREEKFEVQKIEDRGELRKLHQDIFRSLENNGFPIHQKDFLGVRHNPHLALRNRFQRGKAYALGTELAIRNFSLIKQNRLKVTGAMIKSVVKEYELGE